MIRRGFKIQVFSPAHAIPLLKQLCEGENVDFLAVEDFLSDEEYGTELMIDRARKFGRRHAKPVLFLGQDLWWLHSRIRPDIDLNTFFFRLGRIPLSSHRNLHVNDSLRRSNVQFAIPDKPYVLIDHFPGTVREIHKEILDGLESRGFTIVQNPREVKYENLVDLIENASELHFVISSLLCFTQLLKPKADVKVIYPLHKYFYPGHYFYDEIWQEKALHSVRWLRYPSPLDLDRDEEREAAIKSSQKLRYRIIDFVLFRNYKSPIVN